MRSVRPGLVGRGVFYPRGLPDARRDSIKKRVQGRFRKVNLNIRLCLIAKTHGLVYNMCKKFPRGTARKGNTNE